MSKKNEIVVFGNNSHAITCKETKASLNEMIKAMNAFNKSTWIYSYHLEAIVKSASFNTDFKDITEFARFIGISKASVTQYTKAVEFIRLKGFVDCCVDGVVEKNDFTTIPVSVGNAYLLSTLEDYEAFKDWVIDNKHSTENDIFALSVKALKDLIKAYQNSLKDTTADDTTADDTTADDTTADDTTADDTTADEHVFKIRTKDEAITAIKLLMNAYNIALTDLDN